MSQHPSSSGSKSSQHAKNPSMGFGDEDVMDVTPLCMIPGDTTGTASNAGDKQGNTSGNSFLPKDMHYTDCAIRRLVTRILSEGHIVEGVSTPLPRREPSPERKPHADEDDDSSRSEKEVAAEGLCSLGKTLPSKKQNVPQENIIDLEEESTEGEDDPLVHLVKPSVAEKLRSKKGKSMAKMRAARVKKTAGVGPSKPWRKVEVGKRKERHSSDSEENVKDDVPDISPAKRQAVQKFPSKAATIHLDNISFHLEDGAAKWKYVIQRRVAIEREPGQEAVEVKEVIELIKNAGLMKTVATLPQCYEGLIKEFIVNIPEDIHDKNSREFCKVFVRGKCVKFSPNVINKFLERGMDGGVDLETTDNEDVMISGRRESTAKGSLIDQLKETCKELEDGIRVARTRKEALEVLICSMEREDREKAGKESNLRSQSCSESSEDSEGVAEDEDEGEKDTSSSD
ncbi:uncharacterized protein LOC127103566 [Lathyrus oleraceus]|uniref:uncharacterized protein LOC127103566 n=1 Tax=Pisum sativum TaxID=3888 RepID=UPI0021D06BD5|nr:uncharacterized protein LOC127103566 [Pisum sativum]